MTGTSLDTVRTQSTAIAVAGLILLTMATLLSWGYRDKSPTEDEWAHLTRGVAYYQGWDARLHYSHPPFANAVQGLASLGQDLPRMDQARYWKDADVGRVALQFIRSDYPRARDLLMRARVITMCFGLALAAYAFFWGFSLFGPLTGLLAMAFVAFNPTVLAQARYVTTDMAAGAMMTIAIGELSRFLAGNTGKATSWLVPVWLGLAAATKHTGTLLIPLFAVATVLFFFVAKGRYSQSRPAWWKLGLQILGGGLIAWFVLSATYKFDNTFLPVAEFLEVPEPRHWTLGKDRGQVLELDTPLSSLPSWMPIPFPQVYVVGLASVRRHNARGFRSYFMGEPRKLGHPGYFPLMMLIKNPPAMLFGLLAGLAWWVRTRRRPSAAVVCVAGMASVLLASMMNSNLIMGVRHALPIVGLLTLLAGRGAALVLESLGKNIAILTAAWIGATAGSAVLAAPFYLGYFNFLAGGRDAGHEISIYGEDWGQDRVYLARYVEEHELSPFYYNPMTPTRLEEVRYLGLDSLPLGCNTTPPPGSYAALHALSFKTTTRDCWRWRHGLEPIAHINNHIYIWKIPQRDE